MRNVVIIFLILCLSCKYKSPEKENVTEEVEVILNTFEKGIVWVSKNDFKEMYAEAKNLPYKKEDNVRKYTISDSLFSIDKFKLVNYRFNKKTIKNTASFDFKAFRKKGFRNFEIIKESQDIADLDENYNGNLTFSRVIFNRERNRAKYYFEQSKKVGVGRGWGMGTYIYAKKVNGVWVFEKEEEVWIA